MPIFLRYRIIAPCYYAVSTHYTVAKAVAIKSLIIEVRDTSIEFLKSSSTEDIFTYFLLTI